MPGQHILRVEKKNGGFLPVTVVKADMNAVKVWHQRVQPYIAGDPARLDAKWNWPRNFRWLSYLEWANRRRAIILQIMARDSTGSALPIGQVFLSQGYQYLPDPSQPSVYLWFLAAAPKAALQAAGLPTDVRLFKPLVDLAIQFSFNAGYNGRIGLRSALYHDKAIESELREAYHTYVGLEPLGGRLLLSLTRWSEKNYFFASEAKAAELSSALDHLR